jgi:PAS domain S-box-containing protein
LEFQEHAVEVSRVLQWFPDAAAVLDKEGRIVWFNPRAVSLFGHDSGDVMGQTAEILLSDRSISEWRNRIGNASSDFPGSHEVIVTRCKKKDGTEFSAEVSFGSAFGVTGHTLVVIRELLSEVTRRKTAEDQLRKLSRALEQSPVIVVITDTRGDIEYVNPKFTAVTGYSLEEVVGRNPRILKSGKMPPEVYTEIWETITAGKEWRGEFLNRKKDGTLYWEYASLSGITDSQGAITHFVAVKEDITERKRLEEQLLQAQKMEAIGRLAGGIAHDFNNLLTVITGYSELLLDRLSNTDPRRQEVDQIKRAGERARALTSQLLAFSRRQPRTLQILNLNKVVRDMEKMLRRMIGEDIRLITALQPDLGAVKGDPGQIEQVLMNLAVNARDSMPNGGSLTIETADVHLDETYVRSHIAGTVGRYVMLAVSDTGCGMPPEVRSRIFEPFFTTKESGKGTGLGLSTVYGIVKQNSGFVWVYSEPGQGTAFKIYFPCVETERPAVPLSGLSAADVATGSETVFVVEDEEALRSLMARVLTTAGYSVVEAPNGEKALLECRRFERPIHLLMTDLVMPGINGGELAQRAAGIHPEMKVLFLSGYTDATLGKNEILDPKIHYLQKPFGPAELLAKVREVLDS